MAIHDNNNQLLIPLDLEGCMIHSTLITTTEEINELDSMEFIIIFWSDDVHVLSAGH
jgi:hypothetical protein